MSHGQTLKLTARRSKASCSELSKCVLRGHILLALGKVSQTRLLRLKCYNAADRCSKDKPEVC